MKISLIQTETRTLSKETKKQSDVVFEFSATPKEIIGRAWKAVKDFLVWLFS